MAVGETNDGLVEVSVVEADRAQHGAVRRPGETLGDDAAAAVVRHWVHLSRIIVAFTNSNKAGSDRLCRMTQRRAPNVRSSSVRSCRRSIGPACGALVWADVPGRLHTARDPRQVSRAPEPFDGLASARRRRHAFLRRFRNDTRRPTRLCAVLQAVLLFRAPRRSARDLAGRDELPWRFSRRTDRTLAVCP